MPIHPRRAENRRNKKTQKMDNRKQFIRELILRMQIDEIQKHKWIESEKAMRDLGNQAVFDWVQKYAADFRAYWEDRLTREFMTDVRPVPAGDLRHAVSVSTH